MSLFDNLLTDRDGKSTSSEKLSDLVEIHTGQQLNRSGFRPDAEFPVFNGGTNPSGFHGEANEKGPCVIVSQGGASAGHVNWVAGKFWAGAHCFVLREGPRLDKRFLYFTLKNHQLRLQTFARGAGIPGLSLRAIKDFTIQVPPLEVQLEIVQVLDQFTELEAELAAELAAELSARRKQYEHYRDELLNFAKEGEVRWVRMGDVATIVDGTHSTPTYLEAGVPFVSVENIRALNETTKFISREAFAAQYKVKPKSGDLLMTRIGSVGACSIVRDNEPLAYYVTLALIRFDSDLVRPEFAKHFIESRHGRALISRLTIHTAVPIKINLGDIGRVTMPLPSMETQASISSLLDKFDALVSEVSGGLPAEIEARRKQYEYYRDKLLTFPEDAA